MRIANSAMVLMGISASCADVVGIEEFDARIPCTVTADCPDPSNECDQKTCFSQFCGTIEREDGATITRGSCAGSCFEGTPFFFGPLVYYPECGMCDPAGNVIPTLAACMDDPNTTCNVSGYCPSIDPSCVDGQVTNDESDVDCGGTLCSPCGLFQGCWSNTDCLSSNCGPPDVYCSGASCCGPQACTEVGGCPTPLNQCEQAVCIDGFCGTSPLDDGSPAYGFSCTGQCVAGLPTYVDGYGTPYSAECAAACNPDGTGIWSGAPTCNMDTGVCDMTYGTCST